MIHTCDLVLPLVVVRQRKAFRRKNGVTIYFEGKKIGFGSGFLFDAHPRQRRRNCE